MKYLFLILLFLTGNFLFAQTAKFDAVVNQHTKSNHFNGAVIVTENGKPVYIKSAGIANWTDSVLLSHATRFKIASVTKTFTAVLILQLMEEGRLALEDTIGKYLPNYQGEAKNKVTLYQLLTYSSGIPNCDGDSGMAVYQRKMSEDEFIKKNGSGALHFTPGSRFEYNNVDYILLGKMIENITGKTFEQNLQQRICNPLQMQNTGVLSDSGIVYKLASTYTYNDSLKRFFNDEPYYISNFGAAGAMYSTVEDMAKFDAGIFSYKLLKESSVARMIRPVFYFAPFLM